MNRFFVWSSILALVTTASVIGCGSDPGSPTAPTSSIGLRSAGALDVPACGEVTYLSELSGLLPTWRDSITAWLPGVTLNETPAYSGGPVPGYLAQLVPALQQWQGAVNAAVGSALFAPVPAFDPDTTLTQPYLSSLSTLLAGWETAAETSRGSDFLATPPTFVPDTFAPEIRCPADTTISCADTAGVAVDFVVEAMDDCDANLQVVSDPPSGSIFRPGTTTVTTTARDASGNVSTCSFTVTVEAGSVTIESISATPSTLWPPNHKLVNISFDVNATSGCGGPLSSRVLDVTCNEPANGTGDGNTEPDWVIGDDGSLQLRAERSGNGNGRVYTILLRTEDEAGNGDETTVQVAVPHNR
jgi:hypothetical protein